MRSFRPSTACATTPVPESPGALAARISELWRPGNFCLANGLRCAWQFEADETIAWELFRGRLLDPRQTREQRRFLAWNLLPVEGGAIVGEALVSILLDEADREVHVTRGILCRVWEAAATGNTIDAREATRSVRERVGGFAIGSLASAADIDDELRCLLWQAVVGVSRLPLHSVEAPTPEFTFGRLAYFGQSSATVPTSLDAMIPELFAVEVSLAEQAKRLEFAIRATAIDRIPALANAIDAVKFFAVARRMFNDASLSPYTDFVDKALLLMRHVAESPGTAVPGLCDEIDFLASLLRQLTRHLTAYDLVLFHHRGANYPDALLLDAALRRYLELADLHPKCFAEETGRIRRRALRQACLARRRYEGHAVPDAPTSPGENARVLPIAPVPEEQIAEPHRRSRRLFTEASLGSLLSPSVRGLLAQSLRDLAEVDESRELGMALFIDRPLGFFKAPAEVDQTPLLSYEAFSRCLATRGMIECRRLAEELALGIEPDFWDDCRDRMGDVVGLPLDRIPESRRPTASLSDARKASDDFVILRTTPRSLREFRDCFAEAPSYFDRAILVVRAFSDDGESRMMAFDRDMNCLLSFDVDPSRGFRFRAGIEFPTSFQ